MNTDRLKVELETHANLLPTVTSDNSISKADIYLLIAADIVLIEGTKVIFKYYDEHQYEYVRKIYSDKKKENSVIDALSLLLPTLSSLSISLVYKTKDIFEKADNAYQLYANTGSVYTPGLNPAYTFKSFIKDVNNEDAYNAVYAAYEAQPTFLCLVGNVATGKTHLTDALINEIINNPNDNRSIILLSKADYFEVVGNHTRKGTLSSFIQRLIHVDVLAVDDFQDFIDAENPTFLDVLWQILSARYKTYRTDVHTTIFNSHDFPTHLKRTLHDQSLKDNDRFLDIFEVERTGDTYIKKPAGKITTRLREHAILIETPNYSVKRNYIKKILSYEGIIVDNFIQVEHEYFDLLMNSISNEHSNYRELFNICDTIIRAWHKSDKTNIADILEKTIYVATATPAVLKDKDTVRLEALISTLCRSLEIFLNEIIKIESNDRIMLQYRKIIVYNLTEQRRLVNQSRIADYFNLSRQNISKYVADIRRAINENDKFIMTHLAKIEEVVL